MCMRRLVIVLAMITTFGMPVAYAQSPEVPDATSASEPVVDEARIQARVDLLKLTLSATDKRRLTQRCVAAQSRLSAIRAKAALATDKRRQTYHNMVGFVQNIIKGAESRGLAVDLIQQPLTDIQDHLVKFETNYTNYQNALDDARLLNCQTNPEGFKAALEDARLQRKYLLNDMQYIREASLSNLRDGLTDIMFITDQRTTPEGGMDGN